MMFATPCEDYKVNPVLVRARPDLHPARRPRAERVDDRAHVRVVGNESVRRDRGGRRCLWGPAHGGANEACLNMLGQIQAMGGVMRIGDSSQGQGQELGGEADGLRPPRVRNSTRGPS